MSEMEQRAAAAQFAKDWHGRGNEKSDTQTFWISLLQNVFGLRPNETAAFIQFEKSVERLGHAGYIDAYIPSTKVLIEQKSLGVDLDKAFTQAKEYADYLPLSQKPRWIVVSDFATFRVHDMEKPLAPPEVIELKNLAKESHRLKFLVDTGSAALKREEEISLAAGRIIGELYDAFLKLYGENPTEDDLRNLNVLCVRIVFCLYAEDAGILPKNAFHDYLNKFVSSDIRVAMRDFFDTLNTPLAERGRFLDPDLARLPYVNGGLFGDYSSPADLADDADEGDDFNSCGKERNTEGTETQRKDGGAGENSSWESAFVMRGKNKECSNSSLPRVENALSQLRKSATSAKSAGNKNPRFDIPPFSTAMRQLLLQKASLNFDWSAISPTIFGAVFESTLNPDTRRKGGMHYTSVENIHKVIDPLFLDDLWRELGEIVRCEEPRSRRDEESGEESRSREAEISSARRILGSSVGSSISKTTRARLLAFQTKLASLTFLDPACGSGNFLTETYLSLRRLENEVLRVLLAGQSELDLGDLVRVNIHQFYGIEINDFAVTVAKTALWIAESQMLKETEDILHRSLDFLPLKTYSNIVEANALTLDWETVIPRDRLSYIIGNPPFVGARYMSAAQKSDLVGVFGAKWKNVGNLDLVTAWYKKAADLMRGTPIRAALVSTNSICQGESVADLWKPLMADGLTIDFAWRTFRWDSESVGKAHVHCVIVGFSVLPQIPQINWETKPPASCGGGKRNTESTEAQRCGDGKTGTSNWDSAFVMRGKNKECCNSSLPRVENALSGSCRALETRFPAVPRVENALSQLKSASTTSVSSVLSVLNFKTIFSSDGRAHRAANINPYLIDAPDIFIESRSKPLCDVPRIGIGNKPIDGGNYLFTDEEKDAFLKLEPAAAPLFRKWYGAVEFINRKPRWCLWLGDCTPAQLRAMPHCYARVVAVRDYRLASPSAGTRKIADKPTRFHVENMPDSDYLLIPSVSSERRRYVPIGFMDKSDLASNLVLIIPNATLYHFGVLTSSVHMAWMRAVCGRLEMRYRYSKDVVYNNFPWPEEGEESLPRISQMTQMEGDGKERNTEATETQRKDGGAGENSNWESAFVMRGKNKECCNSSLPRVENARSQLKNPRHLRDLRETISQTAQAILDVRARYPDSSLADLYDELTMPPDLRAAHEANDRAVLAAYGFGGGNCLPHHSSDLLRKRPCFAGAVDMISQMTQKEGMGKPNWESDFLNRGNKDVGNSSSPRIANALSQLNKSAPSAKSAGDSLSESAIVAALMRRYEALAARRAEGAS